MMDLTKRGIVLAITSSLVFAFHYPCIFNRNRLSEYSYQEGSPLGPERWGLLHEDWKECNNGGMQSPIDLSDRRVEILHSLGNLKRSYRPANATIVKRDHDIMLKWTDVAGGILLNGTQYLLKQIHWHSPSEHSVNGEWSALELHMVHESEDKKIAVVWILHVFGHADPSLADMEKYIHAIKNVENDEEKAVVVESKAHKEGEQEVLHVSRLSHHTTCTQGVVWTIIKKKFENNARLLQPANDRNVQLCWPASNELIS